MVSSEDLTEGRGGGGFTLSGWRKRSCPGVIGVSGRLEASAGDEGDRRVFLGPRELWARALEDLSLPNSSGSSRNVSIAACPLTIRFVPSWPLIIRL